MPVHMTPAVITKSSPWAMPTVRMSAVTWFEPPGDAGGPHVGALPGVLTGSSPWATLAVRTSARSRPRPRSRARRRCRSVRPRARSPGSTPGGGDGPHVGRPGRCRWSGCRRGPELAGGPEFADSPGRRSPCRAPGRRRRSARRRGPGRAHQVEPLRAVAAVRNSPAVPAVATRFEPPGRWRRSPGRAPGRCRWSGCRRGPGRAHRVEPLGGGGGPELASGPGRGHQVRAPGRCRRSRSGRGQGPELTAGSGRRSPGRAPGRRR